MFILNMQPFLLILYFLIQAAIPIASNSGSLLVEISLQGSQTTFSFKEVHEVLAIWNRAQSSAQEGQPHLHGQIAMHTWKNWLWNETSNFPSQALFSIGEQASQHCLLLSVLK